ncbi:MAG: mannose-1-phosphate guanylyltransferase/mannose-6-phosphate isomerase [Proteobacteria bacterium]|nr:mannose-1-phosphate guanylyltransferase/mannose-6-phosphate isomerase [Pseudomonadota bacterium]
MIPVILSGGSGTRLWPLSRVNHPKQFLSLCTENTLFQDTCARLAGKYFNSPIVICNDNSRFLVAESLREININDATIILEPIARNTAPAIAAAALVAMNDKKDPIMIVLPADHQIKDNEEFIKSILQAKKLAETGKIVTLGITPTEPHTGYGYIEAGEPINESSFVVKRFKEKPDKKSATAMISKGGHFWNGGMFVFKASVYLNELKKNMPNVLDSVKSSVQNSTKDLDFIRLCEKGFAKADNISIDYAVMERTNNAAVVKLDAEWCDVGSWASLWDISEKDACGNAIKGDVVLEDCKNNIIYSDGKLVSAIGVNDLTIVDTKDALLIADRRNGNIRKIVSKLNGLGRQETQESRIVYRPWGHYDTICRGVRDQVKRINVKPGAKLSDQMHHHRSEHWVVVKGTAKVKKGDEEFLLTENQSTYIPLGVTHSLINPGKIPLEIIEIQTGSYLCEDDIIRFDDKYGRK